MVPAISEPKTRSRWYQHHKAINQPRTFGPSPLMFGDLLFFLLLIGGLLASCVLEGGSPPGVDLEPTFDYYVAPTGDDDGPGTENEPWRTISHALTRVQPGDRVGVYPGVYAESLTPITSGTDAKPILLSGLGERVIVDGTSLSGMNQSGLVIDSVSHLQFQNLTFNGWDENGVRVDRARPDGSRPRGLRFENLVLSNNGRTDQNHDRRNGLSIRESDDIVVSRVTAQENARCGLVFIMCEGILLEDSMAINNSPDTTRWEYSDDCDGVNFQNSHSVVVRRCLFEGNGEDGLDIGVYPGNKADFSDGFQGDSAWFSVEDCTARKNPGKGFCASGERNTSYPYATHDLRFLRCVAVGNRPVDNEGEGLGFFFYEGVRRMSIVHATVFGNYRGLRLDAESSHLSLVRSVFDAQDPAKYHLQLAASSQATLIRQNYFRDLKNSLLGTSEKVTLDGSNIVGGDPQFVDVSGTDPAHWELSLRDTSPLSNRPLGLTTVLETSHPIFRVDAALFSDGMQIIPGDALRVVGTRSTVHITNMDEDAIEAQGAVWVELSGLPVVVVGSLLDFAHGGEGIDWGAFNS